MVPPAAVIVIWALAVSDAVGEKVMVKVQVLPAATVAPQVLLLRVIGLEVYENPDVDVPKPTTLGVSEITLSVNTETVLAVKFAVTISSLPSLLKSATATQ